MHDIWEDLGYQYIWSEQAHQFLVGLGIENTAELIKEASERYEQEWRARPVHAPRRLAKTILRNVGISAVRHNSVQIRGERRPILQVSFERHDQETGHERFAADDQPQLQSPPADEAYDQVYQRLQLEGEQDARASLMEQMAEQLGKRLLRPADPVICELHEHGCPRPDKVLAISLAMVSSVLNDLHEQQSWTHEEARALRPYRDRSRQEWEQRLHKRLRDLALDKAQTVDPAVYGGNTVPGRQARSRVARCVLYCLWSEAQAAKFEYFAQQTALTVGWSYIRYLNRRDVPHAKRRRLHAWLRTYQPVQHDDLGCTRASCPATDPEETDTSPGGDL